jgi:hypothetical protein
VRILGDKSKKYVENVLLMCIVVFVDAIIMIAKKVIVRLLRNFLSAKSFG